MIFHLLILVSIAYIVSNFDDAKIKENDNHRKNRQR